jgi:hypothetical protein
MRLLRRFAPRNDAGVVIASALVVIASEATASLRAKRGNLDRHVAALLAMKDQGVIANVSSLSLRAQRGNLGVVILITPQKAAFV